MCRMCDGFRLEDDLALSETAMAEYGSLTIGIDEPDEPNCPNWTYTVGLVEHFDHPELIVAGPAVKPSYDLIHQIGHLILDDGYEFESGDAVESPFGLVLFGTAEHGHLRTNTLEALQIFMPHDWPGDDPARRQPDLSDPTPRVDAR